MMTPYFFTPRFDDPDRYLGYGIYISKLNDKDTLYHHAGRGVGIRSESGYIPARKFGFAVISNLIPAINEEQMKQIDFTKISNQVDIYFLVNHVLKSAVIGDVAQKNKDVRMSNNNAQNNIVK
jgi:hypothetical protein